jgi:peptidoglycan/xylan/chitin deacetylase (PgdA/CDA1 family)
MLKSGPGAAGVRLERHGGQGAGAGAAFTCLMYHSLADGRFPDRHAPKYTTTRARFREHLTALRAGGFRLATFADLRERLRAGTPPGSRSCLLSLDDGHRSSLEMADLMVEAGVRGTFFLTMNYCRERADFLKPDEIRRLDALGFDFGTHGASHRALPHMPAAEMRRELAESKRWLEDVLGRRISSMSLPAGEGGPGVFRAAWELGYLLVGNSVERPNRPEPLPRQVNRFVVLAGHDGAAVSRIAAGSSRYVWQRQARQVLLYLPTRLMRTWDTTRA